jgi:hypothetical protein
VKSRRNILIGLIVLAGIGAVWVGYKWYYRTYKWPAEIQTSVLGSRIVDSRSLLDREGYSHFGEGVFRWRYRIGSENTNLTKQCGDQPKDTCRFTKTRRLEDGVVQTATYSDGILIVEEVWS